MDKNTLLNNNMIRYKSLTWTQKLRVLSFI